MRSPSITVVQGDFTTLSVDAVVNAANNAMRGGGGVDGAIHRVGGPAVLADCIARFPHGLHTGDAGWTTAGNLPASWVIHTVGPRYRAEEADRLLLVSCYRRSLEVADELGVRTIAFPLISAGSYGWPLQDAIAAAVEGITQTATRVTAVELVAFDQLTYDAMRHHLAVATPLRILQAIRVLHSRGHQQTRILPGMSPSGMYWRVSVSPANDPGRSDRDKDLSGWLGALHYSSADGGKFADADITPSTPPEAVAEAILTALPGLEHRQDDPAYADWYTELLHLVEQHNSLPIAYADYFDAEAGWEIGWGSGIRFRHPPSPPA